MYQCRLRGQHSDQAPPAAVGRGLPTDLGKRAAGIGQAADIQPGATEGSFMADSTR